MSEQTKVTTWAKVDDFMTPTGARPLLVAHVEFVVTSSQLTLYVNGEKRGGMGLYPALNFKDTVIHKQQALLANYLRGKRCRYDSVDQCLAVLKNHRVRYVATHTEVRKAKNYSAYGVLVQFEGMTLSEVWR